MKGKDFTRLERLTARFQAGDVLSSSEKRQLRKLSAALGASQDVHRPWRKRGYQKRHKRLTKYGTAAMGALLKNPDPLGRK